MTKILFVVTVIIIGCTAVDAHPQWHGQANFGVFYSSLSPYGEWIQADLGYVWRPSHISRAWRPYSYGRWVWSDYGWYWVSDEPFGWATFHYGRWHYDDYYGWVWVPDNVWAPAWVEWRYDDDYIGWAPLPPVAHFSISVGITYAHSWIAPVHYWNFVSCRRFTASKLPDYIESGGRSQRIYGRTRSASTIAVENQRVVNRGIERDYVERYGKTRVEKIELMDADQNQGERFTKDRTRVSIYRPDFRNNDQQKETVRPPNVRKTEREIRIGGERKSDIRRTEPQTTDNPSTFQHRGTDGNRKSRNGELSPPTRVPNTQEREQKRDYQKRPESFQRRENNNRVTPEKNRREIQTQQIPRENRRQEHQGRGNSQRGRKP